MSAGNRHNKQTTRQDPAKRDRIPAEPLKLGKAVVGRGIQPRSTLQAAHQLKRAESAGRVQQLVRGRVIRVREPMFDIGFADKLRARQLECFHPGFRPGPAGGHVRQHSQALGIREQGVDSSFAGRSDELARIFDAGMVVQKLTDTLIGQRIEAQDPDLVILRYRLQVDPIVGPEPVRLTAGEAEPGSPERMELGANAIQRGAPVFRTGPHLVEPVDEE